jgi:NADH dehydrogenase/NADH:ubiquinone oxidoreductase subunit G
MSDPDKISFWVEGRPFDGRRGDSLIDALRSHGFSVPSLCHTKGLKPYGACRICLVEIDDKGHRKLTTACNTPLQDGLEVFLDTEKVNRNRKRVLELLLAMAPGSQELRSLAGNYGVEKSRLMTNDSSDNCILCGLCVRVCREGARASAISISGRGLNKTLNREPFDEFPADCIACGACAYVCPTDAISMEGPAVSRLKDKWGQVRPCRFSLMGLAPGSLCENDYQCKNCEVDQNMIDRAAGRHPVFLLLEQKITEVKK